MKITINGINYSINSVQRREQTQKGQFTVIDGKKDPTIYKCNVKANEVISENCIIYLTSENCTILASKKSGSSNRKITVETSDDLAALRKKLLCKPGQVVVITLHQEKPPSPRTSQSSLRGRTITVGSIRSERNTRNLENMFVNPESSERVSPSDKEETPGPTITLLKAMREVSLALTGLGDSAAKQSKELLFSLWQPLQQAMQKEFTNEQAHGPTITLLKAMREVSLTLTGLGDSAAKQSKELFFSLWQPLQQAMQKEFSNDQTDGPTSTLLKAMREVSLALARLPPSEAKQSKTLLFSLWQPLEQTIQKEFIDKVKSKETKSIPSLAQKIRNEINEFKNSFQLGDSFSIQDSYQWLENFLKVCEFLATTYENTEKESSKWRNLRTHPVFIFNFIISLISLPKFQLEKISTEDFSDFIEYLEYFSELYAAILKIPMNPNPCELSELLKKLEANPEMELSETEVRLISLATYMQSKEFIDVIPKHLNAMMGFFPILTNQVKLHVKKYQQVKDLKNHGLLAKAKIVENAFNNLNLMISHREESELFKDLDDHFQNLQNRDEQTWLSVGLGVDQVFSHLLEVFSSTKNFNTCTKEQLDLEIEFCKLEELIKIFRNTDDSKKLKLEVKTILLNIGDQFITSRLKRNTPDKIKNIIETTTANFRKCFDKYFSRIPQSSE